MKKNFKIKLIIIIFATLLVIGATTFSCVAYINNPLIEIYLKSLPVKTTYYEFEDFDDSGLEVVAKYKYYSKERIIENFSIITDSPLTNKSKEVVISYTEKGITKTTSLKISVIPRIISDIEIISQPSKTQYFVGEFFDVEGLKLQVNCERNSPSFEPTNIQINKFNVPLTLSDNEILIAYTEGEKTVFTNIKITVKEITTEEEQMQVVNDLVEFLPNLDELKIEDSDTIDYIEGIVEDLTEEQKEALGVEKIFQELNEKLEILKKEEETRLNIEYNITYKLKDKTSEFESNNISVYKNISGAILLNNPVCTELENAGYAFSHWENEYGAEILEIHDISKDTIYYAVYKLTSTIDLCFVDIENNNEIGLISVERYNGTYFQYNLINNEINNLIYNKSNKIPKQFFINNEAVTSITTDKDKVRNIGVELVSIEELVESNIPASGSESILFISGDNVREFTLNEGYLSKSSLSDINVYYNEQNNNYINYYIVDGENKVYDDLSSINFNLISEKNIVVLKVENRFSLSINFTDGEKIFSNLIGKQTIESALLEYANDNNEILNLIYGLSEKIDFSQYLNSDLVLNLQERKSFNLILHNDSIVSRINIPDATTHNYYLSNELPQLQKLGYIFVGWALSENGDILSNEYINIVIQNYNIDRELFAVWKINPNYNFPESEVFYEDNFVGEWTANLNYNGKILDIILNLTADGIYRYSIFSNGILNTNISGEYRYENEKIKVYSVEIDGNYQYISKEDVYFDLSFLESNILIASGFYKIQSESILRIECFDIALIKGKIKFANYYGEQCLGSYQFIVKDILTNISKSYIIKLTSNGNAVLTVDGKTQNAVFRVIGDKIILISNGSLGIREITEFIVEENKI